MTAAPFKVRPSFFCYKLELEEHAVRGGGCAGARVANGVLVNRERRGAQQVCETSRVKYVLFVIKPKTPCETGQNAMRNRLKRKVK